MNLAAYSKSIIALLVPLITFANQKWGLSLPVDDQTLGMIVAAVTSVIVWAVPNAKA